jgi:hypothetical protein
MIIKECKKCREQFKVYPYQILKTEFCSHKCWKNFCKDKLIVKYCEVCNKEFRVFPSLDRLKYCSRKCKGEAMKGNSGYWEGKERLSMKGDKNYSWKGGKSFEQYPQDWSDDLKDSIRKRDNYICQECGIHQDELVGIPTKLDVHHINYDKQNCSPDNLIALCRSCHIKTNKDRDNWIEYFNKII